MDASPHQEVRLPESVEKSIKRLREEKHLPPLKKYARKMLEVIGEEASAKVLSTISSTNKDIGNFSGFVSFLVKADHPIQAAAVLGAYSSPQTSPPTPRMFSPSPALAQRLMSKL